MNDIDSNMTRLIYPGRKIIRIEQGILNTNILIYESGLAKLARLEIPSKYLEGKSDNSFEVDGRKINQAWKIKAERVPILIRTDYVNRSNSKPCQIQNEEGVMGPVWEVIDTRYDYVIHFVNEVTNQDIGTFVAIGETKSVEKKINTEKRCYKKVNIFDKNEAF